MSMYKGHFGTIEFTCDHGDCGESEEFDGVDGHADLEGASEDARENGWNIFKKDGEWTHLCPAHNTDTKQEDD